MDVTKIPPPGAALPRAPATQPGEPGSPSAGHIATIADRADIRPLDVPAALQILLAEVRAAFELQALLIGGEGGGENVDSPTQAARVMVDMAVQSLPDEASVPVWTVELMRMETALQSGLQRAVDAVSAWRDV